MAALLPNLPKLDLSALTAAVAADKAKKAAAADPTAGMTAEQLADFNARVELAMNPRGAVGEIGAGLGRGIVHGIPEMVGQALRSTGKEGDLLYGAGKALGGVAHATRNVGLPDPESHGTLTNWTAQAMESIPSSLLAMAPAIAAAAATGGAAAPVAIAGAAGLMLPSSAQFQDTYERGKAKGLTDSQAFTAGVKTGASEFATEFLPTMIGARVLTGHLTKTGMTAPAAAADALRQPPSFTKSALKAMGASAAAEVPTEMVNAAIQNTVEANAKIAEGDAWGAATGAFGPSLIQSALFGIVGGKVSHSRDRSYYDVMRAGDAVLADPTASMSAKIAATKEQADLISTVIGNREAANMWRVEQLDVLTDQVRAKQRAQQAADAMTRFTSARDRIIGGAQQADGNTLDYINGELLPDVDGIFRAAKGDFALQPSPKGDVLAPLPFDVASQPSTAGQYSFDFTTPSPARTYRQSNVDAATERLAAIQPQENVTPNEGTARALGLQRTGVVAPAAAGATVNLTQQQRVATVKGIAPAIPAKVRNELAALPPQAFPEALQQIWHDKGGEAGPLYNQKIEAEYTRLTGKDIRDVTPASRLSDRPSVALDGDSTLTTERLADEQTTRQHEQVGAQLAQDKASRTAVKQRMGDLFSGKATPTTKESRARQAQVKFDNAVANFKAALDSFDAQVQGTQNAQAATPVDQGAKPQSTPDQTGAVAAPATAKRDAKARNAKPGQGTATEPTGQEVAAKAARKEAFNAGQERKDLIAARDAAQANLNKLAASRKASRTELSRALASVNAAQKSLDEFDTNPQGRAVHGNVKSFGAKDTPTQVAAKYDAETAARLTDELSRGIAQARTGKPDAAPQAQDRAKAKELMGRKGGVWRSPQEWVESPLVRRALGKFHDQFKATVGAVDTESIGTGKDLTNENAQIIDDLEAQAIARRGFSKRMAQVVEDAGLLEADTELPIYDLHVDRSVAPTPEHPATRASIRNALRNWFITPEQAARRVVVVDTFDALPNDVKALLTGDEVGTQAFVVNGKGYMIADRIAAGTEEAVFMHEIGVHVGLSGNETAIAERVRLWASAPANSLERRVYEAAKQRLDAANSTSDAELVAYATEEAVMEGVKPRAVKAGLKLSELSNVQDLVDWFAQYFKAAVDKMFGNNVRGFSPQNLVDMAYGAARAAMKSEASGTSEVQRSIALAGNGSLFQQIKDAWAKLVERVPAITEVPHLIRKNLYALSTAEHIKQWVDKTPALKPVSDMVNQFYKAYDDKTYLIQAARQEFHGFLSGVEAALSEHSKNAGERAQLEKRLAALSGETSRWGLNLDSTYADNKTSGISAADFNRLQTWWKAMPEPLKQAVRNGVKINRKFYTLNTAALVYNALSMYADRVPEAAALRDTLKLTEYDENANARITDPVHIDAKSKHFASALENVLSTVRALPETQANSGLKSDMKIMGEYYAKATKNPYFHLGREGNYFTRFTADIQKRDDVEALADKFGAVVMNLSKDNAHVFIRFKTLQQAKAFSAAVKDQNLSDGKAAIEAGAINEQGAIGSLTGVPAFIRTFLQKLEKDFTGDNIGLTKAQLEGMRTTMMQFAIESLPESAPQKALARRKHEGIAGYEADFVHSFAKRAEGMSTSISNAYTMPDFDNALAAMREKATNLSETDPDAQAQVQEVYHELAQRLSNSMNPVESPLIDKAKAFGYNYFLALSPAFMLVNSMQPYHIALPVIGSKFGFADTASAMFKAAGISMSTLRDTYVHGWKNGKFVGVVDAELATSNLSPAHKELVQHLMRRGRLDFTQAHELGRMASGESHGWALATKMMSLGSHITELNNRLTTAIAAYDLARAPGEKQMSKEQALDYALRVVDDTQYNYADHNTARHLGRHGMLGKLTPLFFSFQQYQFQSMELLARLTRDAFSKQNPHITEAQQKEARSALKALYGTTAVIAGGLGLPFASVVAAVADKLFGDDDDPLDSRIAVRNWLSGVFGQDVGEILARGVPRALGVDVSSRAGWQDLMPGSRFLTDKRKIEDAMKDGALAMYGPAVNAAVDVGVGLSLLGEGRVLDAAIQGLPLALRNPAKAAKMAGDGFTTRTDNELPMDVNGWDVLVQGMGFTPAKKAEQSEANFAFKVRDAQLKQQQAKITRDLYRGVERGEDMDAALKRYSEFVRTHPTYAGDPNAGLTDRAKSRAVAAISGTGIPASTKYLPELQRYQFANTR